MPDPVNRLEMVRQEVDGHRFGMSAASTGPSVSAHAGIVNAIKATSDLLSSRSKIIALAPPFAVLRG